MRVIRNRPEWTGGSYPSGRTAVAIGNFDGVHRGHQALIDRCGAVISGNDSITVVTFEPLPQTFFRPNQAPARIFTVYQKLDTLRSLGVDYVWQMRFTQAFANLTAREFVELALVRRLQAKCVVIGEDFQFRPRPGGRCRFIAIVGGGIRLQRGNSRGGHVRR